MSVTPGMNRNIKDALVTILGSLTYGGEPAFTAVLDNTRDETDGQPIARVLPAGFKSATATNVTRDHTVSYSIILTWSLQDPSDIESNLYDALYDYTALIVNALESDDYTGELTKINSSITDWLMNVPDVKWRLAVGKNGALLCCEVTVDISYSQELI